jgi:hypothetical protein
MEQRTPPDFRRFPTPPARFYETFVKETIGKAKGAIPYWRSTIFPPQTNLVAESGYLKKFLAAMKSMAGIRMPNAELPTVAQPPVRLR